MRLFIVALNRPNQRGRSVLYVYSAQELPSTIYIYIYIAVDMIYPASIEEGFFAYVSRGASRGFSLNYLKYLDFRMIFGLCIL